MGSISLKKVTLKYDQTKIIDSLSEVFFDGELYVLLGPSGSGKTSLLKIMAGLSLLSGGEVEVGGENIWRYNQRQMLDYHKQCGFVFQNAALIGNMSIYENLTLYYNYHTDMKEKEIYERIKEHLDYVDFKEDLTYRPAALSMGERVLVAIVRAISHDPKYIFWDNPLANLDTIFQKRVKKIINDFKKERKTMVMVTTDYDFAFSVADRVGILYGGKILESGLPEEIKNSKLKITRELINQD